jgi:SprT-like family
VLRALLARFGLTSQAGEQLELGLGAATSPTPVASPPQPPPRGGPDDAPRAPRPDADAFLSRLRALGLSGITTLRLTRNRSTLVSFRAGVLRVHEGFTRAPEEVQRALVTFVCARGRARAAARAMIVAHPLPRDPSAARRRTAREHPDDAAMAQRLQREHARLNAERFGGTLRTIRVSVSRRMHTRLGHYAPARGHPEGGEISISRRHIRRHGWREAFDTLLHEMVHQWQEESGHPLDHGPRFRRKAREVGTAPSARRVLR